LNIKEDSIKEHILILKDEEFPLNVRSIDFKQKHKRKIKILVAQPEWNQDDFFQEINDLFYIKNIDKCNSFIQKTLEKALEKACHIIIFPELSIPKDYLDSLQEYSKNNKIMIIAGSHYIDQNETTISISPIFIDGERYNIEKIIPAPFEKSPVEGKGLSRGMNLYKFMNTSSGNISILICADYITPEIKQTLLKDDDIDILVVIAYQKDSNRYFENMNPDVRKSDQGLYIIYANNKLAGGKTSADGNSAIFGLVDNDNKLNFVKYTYDSKFFKLTNGNYIIATLDITAKKPPKIKNTLDGPNIILDGEIASLHNNDYDLKQIKNKCEYYSITEKYRSQFNFFTMSKSFEILKDKIENKLSYIEFMIISGLHPTSSLISAEMDSLLQGIKEFLDIYFQDVAVNIKMVSFDDNENYFLSTIARAKSDKEKKLDERTRDEIFNMDKYTNINELKSKFPKEKTRTNTQSVNSAYLNVIHYETDKEWICNDLKFAESVDYFYSNSFQYHKYYNSLAVFPIVDKHFDDTIGLEKIFRGILIFDTLEKNGFEPTIIKNIGGYLAHRINSLLSLMDESR
jgi:predicted amidohydrolase